MTARWFFSLASLPALLLSAGCSNPGGDRPTDDPAPAETTNLPVAPAPRAKGEAPPPQPALLWTPPRSDEPPSELILGKWISVKHTHLGWDTVEFTRDGTWHWRHSDERDGLRVWTELRPLVGNTFQPPRVETLGQKICESTISIESINPVELTLLVIEKRQLTPEAAKQLATADTSAGTLMSQVEERHHQSFYVRPKD